MNVPIKNLGLRLSLHRKQWYIPIILIVVLVEVVGHSFNLFSHAATPYASSFANRGTLTSGASVVPDSQASDGESVLFGGSQSSAGCLTGANLDALLAGSPNNGTITLPAGECWTIQSPIIFQAHSNVTIDGNGDTINDTYTSELDTAWSPIMELFQDSNLTLTNLTLNGPGAKGGPNGEPESGIVAEADTGLTINNVTMMNIWGDFFVLDPNKVHETPVTSVPNPVNSNIVVTNCNWTAAGYHGVTIEAVQGASFTNDTISDVSIDAIDMEYDGSYQIGPTGPGWPQTGVVFSGDTFKNDGQVVLNTANTGITPVTNLTFSNNKLLGTTQAIFDIAGVAGGDPVTNLIITNNTAVAATAGPDPNNTISLTNVSGATIENNTFPWYWYVQPANTAHLLKVPVNASSSSGVNVENNSFIGALKPTAGTIATDCGNTYSVTAYQAIQITEPQCAN